MSLTDRDRKIVMVLIPLLAVLGYWFLLLGPKREAAAKAGDALAQQEQKRDDALGKVNQALAAKAQFATKYASLVRLGKAVPTTVDMPSLMVQLDAAARGTGIRFSRIGTGTEEGGAGGGAAPAPAPPPAGGSGGGSTPPAAAGGTPAQSAPGQGAEKANNAAAQGNANTAKKDPAASGAPGGAAPSGGAAGAAPSGGQAGAGAAPCAPGLACVPLEFEFSGGFFELADFFHRLKRFVRVANDRIAVQGRLMTVDQFKFSSGEQSFPSLKAEVTATVYLAPKAEGATAGATPSGPNASASASPQPSPASPPAPPAATATP